MVNNLSDAAAVIKNNETKSIVDEVTNMHKEIVLGVQVATLPEYVFIEYFLDFFRNGGVSNSSSSLILKWLEVANGPYNEVNIIDSNGQIAFTVPGLYARPTPVAGSSNIDFSTITSKFNLKANRIHEDGVNYLNQQLQGVNKTVATDQNITAVRWGNIFNRYDKKDSVIKQLKTTNTDFLDYD